MCCTKISHTWLITEWWIPCTQVKHHFLAVECSALTLFPSAQCPVQSPRALWHSLTSLHVPLLPHSYAYICCSSHWGHDVSESHAPCSSEWEVMYGVDEGLRDRNVLQSVVMDWLILLRICSLNLFTCWHNTHSNKPLQYQWEVSRLSGVLFRHIPSPGEKGA